MAILVTGGCGFVGTALTQNLLKNGEKIILMDLCPPKPVCFLDLKN
jgi:nucleoside-diphosphate-sugar epimerase